MTSPDDLDRTVALFKADLDIGDATIIHRRLTGLTVALVAGDDVMRTKAGQVALLTSALLLARSGHKVFVNIFDAPLIGYQPPFSGKTVYDAIKNLAGQLIEGSDISIGYPVRPDVAFDIGGRSSIPPFIARKTISVGWSAWAGEIASWPWKPPTTEHDWPMGAMAAAVLVASEAIKFVGLALAPISSNPSTNREMFAFAPTARLELAPEDTPRVSTLGIFDIISAGAISNAVLYALLRLPHVTGDARAFDRDVSDVSNLNRNMLLTRRTLPLSKVGLFHALGRGLVVERVERHFAADDLESIAENVVVGVDDVPTRWLLAGARVNWMGVGATSHFGSMASVHFAHSACAACQHPHDESVDGPIPTIAFVSFLSGLMVAADFLREISRSTASLESSQRFLTALRCDNPDNDYRAKVHARADCPAKCAASQLK